MHDDRKRSNHKSYLTHVNINTQTYHIHTCTHKPTIQPYTNKHMNISTLSYAQIQWEFSCGKICRTLLLSATRNDRCVEISPWQCETWTVHLRTCSYYTAVQERVYNYTRRPSHPHTHTDSLEHFSTCRYNPHAVSPQWSQILQLVMRDGGWLEIMHFRTTNVLPLPQTWLELWRDLGTLVVDSG